MLTQLARTMGIVVRVMKCPKTMAPAINSKIIQDKRKSFAGGFEEIFPGKLPIDNTDN